jgi:hypothetical protein
MTRPEGNTMNGSIEERLRRLGQGVAAFDAPQDLAERGAKRRRARAVAGAVVATAATALSLTAVVFAARPLTPADQPDPLGTVAIPVVPQPGTPIEGLSERLQDPQLLALAPAAVPEGWVLFQIGLGGTPVDQEPALEMTLRRTDDDDAFAMLCVAPVGAHAAAMCGAERVLTVTRDGQQLELAVVGLGATDVGPLEQWAVEFGLASPTTTHVTRYLDPDLLQR